MKTIGLIGGISWESTVEYYRLINDQVHRLQGGHHSAKILMYSFDFEEVKHHQEREEWAVLDRMMTGVGLQLEAAGADFLVICANTMHRCVPAMEAGIRIPILHIADATGEAICSQGLKKIGLIGTRYTMEGSFYVDRLRHKFGLEPVIPSKEQRELIHRVIYEELVTGTIWQPSKRSFLEVIGELASQGAEGVILGCTEIPLLVKQEDTTLPLFDTTALHAHAAVKRALE